MAGRGGKEREGERQGERQGERGRQVEVDSEEEKQLEHGSKFCFRFVLYQLKMRTARVVTRLQSSSRVRNREREIERETEGEREGQGKRKH